MTLGLKRAVVGLLGAQRVRAWRNIPPSYRAYHRDWLQQVPDPERRRAILRRWLSFVEVEVHSHCNRRCWFCPNSTVDRRSTVEYLPESVYVRLLEELRQLRFSGTVSFSRYNEPFSDPVLYERLRQARAALADAILFTNSNGDFVDREALQRSSEAGLDRLAIQHYAGPNGWDPGSALTALRRMADRLGLDPSRLRRAVGSLRIITSFGAMHIELVSVNWGAWRVSRGGTVSAAQQNVQRTAPCTHFFGSAYVDYNGSVMPCCNVRSDVAEHRGLVLGNLLEEDRTLSDVLFAPKAVSWRRQAAAYQAWSEPCRTCEAYAMPDDGFWRWAWAVRRAL